MMARLRARTADGCERGASHFQQRFGEASGQGPPRNGEGWCLSARKRIPAGRSSATLTTTSGITTVTLTSSTTLGFANLSAADAPGSVVPVTGDDRVEFVSAGPPSIASATPQTIVSGTTTDVILKGANLHGMADVMALDPDVVVTSVRYAHYGDALIATLRCPAGFAQSVFLLRVSNQAGNTQVALQVLDGRQPLLVPAGTTVSLAGTNRFASITVQATGTIRGVGLLPLVLVADGAIQVDGTIDVSGSPATPPPGASGSQPPGSTLFPCGDGGNAGPGGGGGGGGGAAERSNVTIGGAAGWGFAGGGGGGGSPGVSPGAGGMGAGTFGRRGKPLVAAYSA